MFLTKMSESANVRILSLEKLALLLPSPLRPLHGKLAAPLALPDNIICFCRRTATDLNSKSKKPKVDSNEESSSKKKKKKGLSKLNPF